MNFQIKIYKMWRTLESRKGIALTDSLVQRLERSETLQGHRGCVNTIRWNYAGDKILSGSDDCKVWQFYFYLLL
jgi:WD40 repeat protein